MDLPLAVVRRPVRLEQLFGHALKLALAALGEVAALGPRGGVLIEEGGDLQLVPNALCNALGQLNTLLERHVHRWNERDDVGCAHARVLADVLGHIDGLGGLPGQAEGDLLDALGRAHQRKDAAVVAAVGLDVQQRAAGHGIGDIHQALEHDRVDLLADAEIRNAFNETGHGQFLLF